MTETTNFEEAHDKLECMMSCSEEIIKEAFHRMPFNQDLVLSNGRIGRFKTFFEPREKDGRWEFGFDFKFDDDGRSPDHLEFYVKHTGGGGGV